MINYKELEDKIYNYPTKNPEGFILSEYTKLLEDYPNIDKEKFNDALTGITCMVDPDNQCIIYHCDIYKAIVVGLEGRELRTEEID